MSIKTFHASHYPSARAAHWLEDSIGASSLEESDLLILPGGSDINPALYNEKDIHPRTHFYDSIDELHSSLFKEAVKQGKFIVGICRGAQMGTALSGGRLIQHVTNHAGMSHPIEFNDGEIHKINSLHHQMCWPYQMDKNDYELIAWSYEKLSRTYDFNSNEVKEEIEFDEPEIIYYPKTRCLAIQGHPEMLGRGVPVVEKINQIIHNKL